MARRPLLGLLGLLVACAKAGAPSSESPGPGVDADTGPSDTLVFDAPVVDAAVVPPDACVPMVGELLVNPALDAMPQGAGWVDARDPLTNALPGGPYPIISSNPASVPAHTSPFKAWLGGAAGEDVTPQADSLTDLLYQDITIPADATDVIVSGYYLVGTNELGGVYDTFTLDLIEPGGATIETVLAINNTTFAGDFTVFTKPLATNVAGKTVRLRAISVNDGIWHTNFFLDSLSVRASFCP